MSFEHSQIKNFNQTQNELRISIFLMIIFKITHRVSNTELTSNL